MNKRQDFFKMIRELRAEDWRLRSKYNNTHLEVWVTNGRGDYGNFNLFTDVRSCVFTIKNLSNRQGAPETFILAWDRVYQFLGGEL